VLQLLHSLAQGRGVSLGSALLCRALVTLCLRLRETRGQQRTLLAQSLRRRLRQGSRLLGLLCPTLQQRFRRL
jgi:hypothetical protein